MMGDGQRFCLKWNDFRSSVTQVFEDLRQDEELVDITLCCDGKKIKAHRMMLSACSPYFRDLLKENPCQHPVFFLKDTTFADLQAVIQFVYNGEVNVTQAQLSSFLKTAEMLQVRGLTGDEDKEPAPPPAMAPVTTPQKRPPPVTQMPLQQPVRRPPPAPVIQPPPMLMQQKRPAPAPVSQEKDSYVEPVVVSVDSPEPPPASPASKRRRRSGSGSQPPTPSMHSESSQDVPPAPASTSGLDQQATPSGSSGDLPGSSSQHQHQPQHPADTGDNNTAGGVKVEKIDIADDDESLQAALGHMASYEGSYDSDQSLGAIPVMDSSQGAGMPGTSADGGATQGWFRGVFFAPEPDRPFACHLCPRKYARKQHLQAHKKMHTGETTCHICSRAFTQMSHLKVHLVEQHGVAPR